MLFLSSEERRSVKGHDAWENVKTENHIPILN
jgi:hypothetical protein